MSKILVLAHSGFGKSTSIGKNEALGIVGLDPEKTYLITVTSKELPFPGSAKQYPSTRNSDPASLNKARRFISNNAAEITKVLSLLAVHPTIENIVLDDFNYIMQDWFMDNALKQGWDAPKKIGYDIGAIFKTLEKIDNKNVIVLAHYQTVKTGVDETRMEYQMKTTGKMVDEYLTPGGKFDITLVGKSRVTGTGADKKVERYFVTNDDGETPGAKSAPGMLPITIPNDLGVLVADIKKYYEGQ
jgi:hypothetical protein